MAIISKGKRRSKPVIFRQFHGFCPDVDASELPPFLASDAQNVDFDGETVRKRLGKSGYNTSFGAGRILGALAYYPKTGTRKMVAAWGTTYKADDGAGVFSNIATGLNAAADHVDILQFRDTVYLGNGLDALYSWPGSGSAAALALLTAPSAAPTMALRSTVAQNFDALGTLGGSDITAGWVVSGGAITLTLASASSVTKVEGTDALKAQFTAAGARGSSFAKKWTGSVSGMLDLSTAEKLIVYVYAEKVGMSFKIGIIKNGDTTPDFSLFQSHVMTQKEAWVAIETDISQVAPQDRTASPGIGIQFLEKKAGAAFPVALYFDQAQPQGPLETGRYQYRYTWAEVDSDGNVIGVGETNPSPVGTIEIPAKPPTEGVYITPAAGGLAALNAIRIFRYYELGTLQFSHLLATAPNDNTTLGAAVSDTTGTTFTVASSLGMSPGNILQVDTEKVMVRVVASATSITVVRGVDGSTAATHLNAATVSFVKHFDAKSQGALILDPRAERLIEGRQTVPVANVYALANNRLWAGGPLISGTRYPWQIWNSREGFPEEFSNTQDPGDPTLGGWFNLPEKDAVTRILDLDGEVLILADRSIWGVEGSGWQAESEGGYVIRQRAAFGLDARNAVVYHDQLIYLLSADGIRVIQPSFGDAGIWRSWIISEPVASILRAIPKAARSLCALGVDERGRIEFSYPTTGDTYPTRALVFDPRIPGALARGEYQARPGWTLYTVRGAGVYVTLKRGGGDDGELLAGDPNIGRFWNHNRAAGADILTDDGAAIAWHWQSKAEDAGPHAEAVWVSSDAVFDAQNGAAVTFTAIKDLGNASVTAAKTLPANTSLANITHLWGAATRGRFHQIKLNGSHSVAMRLRTVSFSLFVRGA